jgi:hypothetical protein
MNEVQLADLLSDPANAHSLDEALSIPQGINMIIQSNPILKQMGSRARGLLRSVCVPPDDEA